MITRSSGARGRRIYGHGGIYNRRPMWPLPNFGRARSLPLFAVLLLVLSAVGLVFAAAAGADAISPEAGPSDNAKDIDTLYKIVFALGVGVIALVWGVLFYSLFRFRARRGRTAPQIRGNTTLELGWTIGAPMSKVPFAMCWTGSAQAGVAAGRPARATAATSVPARSAIRRRPWYPITVALRLRGYVAGSRMLPRSVRGVNRAGWAASG